jgi:hypothetical protein
MIRLVKPTAVRYIPTTALTMPATVLAPRTLYDKIWEDHVVFVGSHLALQRS